MGSTEVPLRDYQCLKMPIANYEFGVNFMDPKLMMFGRLLIDGRLNARIKWDLSNDPSFNANALLMKEPNTSHGMFSFDYKGHDYRIQFHFGNASLFGGNCIQVSLATEFMYNYLSTEAVATVGYDHILGHAFVSRLIRGKIDTNGCNSAVLEERLNMGLKFVLSAEIDHEKKDYRFGFGLTVGQGKRIEKLFRHLLSHFVA